MHIYIYIYPYILTCVYVCVCVYTGESPELRAYATLPHVLTYVCVCVCVCIQVRDTNSERMPLFRLAAPAPTK
jgi:hypothetical protein